MFRQLMKSAFWDGWDNLIPILAGNAIFVAVAALWYLGAVSLDSVWLSLLVQAFLGAVAGAHACALAGMFARSIDTGYKGASIRAYLVSLRGTAFTGLVAGLLSSTVLGLLALTTPFWLTMGALGIVATGICLWAAVWALLSMAWIPAVCANTGATGLAAFQKAFAAAAGNPGLTIFLAFYNAFSLILSLPLAMLVPGPAGTVMARLTALRLDLLRYRWLVDQAESRGGNFGRTEMRQVPWDKLLKNERERTAGRRLRDAFSLRAGDR